MRQGNPEIPGVPTPLLSLNEFFEGNDFVGSIGCNLDSEPTPQEFFQLLEAIKSRQDVSDVRIQISCVDDPGEDWPFSDTVWIMTSASEEAVQSWFPSALSPDEVWTGWTTGVNYEALEVDAAHEPVAVWFD